MVPWSEEASRGADLADMVLKWWQMHLSSPPTRSISGAEAAPVDSVGISNSAEPPFARIETPKTRMLQAACSIFWLNLTPWIWRITPYGYLRNFGREKNMWKSIKEKGPLTHWLCERKTNEVQFSSVRPFRFKHFETP